MPGDNDLKNNLADQSYWDSGYSGYELTEQTDEDAIKKWIAQYIPANKEGTCFEVGCFPGRYLTFIGKLGYELNGLDLTPRVQKEFPEWLRSRGYKVGSFYMEDFFKFKNETQYDVVCSFGFIEHFKNWEEVFIKHLPMVKKGGYLIIETPNFKGIMQRLIHFLLDYENYKRHYIPAMNPSKWEQICRKNGFNIIHKGYIGEFQFWVDKAPVKGWRKSLFQKLIDNYPRLKKMKPGNPMYAPYCGIIAKRG
jgi:L-malate glycosyltransferase